MHIHRLTHVIDVHAAGWPLRVLQMPATSISQGIPLAESTRAIWQDSVGQGGYSSPVRWLQQEPRGHAAMRIGAIAPSVGRLADVFLHVFDANGPCRADGLDAICAAAAMDESGLIAGVIRPGRCTRHAEKVIQTGNGLYRVRKCEEDAMTYTVLSDDRPARIVERDRSVQAGHLSLAADIVLSGSERYAIINVQGSGLTMRIDRISELTEVARCAQSAMSPLSSIVLSEGDTGQVGHMRIAVFDAYGNLLRAPGSRALHAIMTLLSEGDIGVMAGGITAEGLNGGTVICRAAARQTIDANEFSMRITPWEILCRPFVTGSLQFVMDPDDEAGEGFLLR